MFVSFFCTLHPIWARNPRWQAVIQGRPEQLETQLVPLKEAFGVAESELQEFPGGKHETWGIGVNVWWYVYGIRIMMLMILMYALSIFRCMLRCLSQVVYCWSCFLHHFLGIWDRFPCRSRWNGGCPKYFTWHRYLQTCYPSKWWPWMLDIVQAWCWKDPMVCLWKVSLRRVCLQYPPNCSILRISTKLSELEERKQKRAEEAEAAGDRWFVGWWVNDWSWWFRSTSRA